MKKARRAADVFDVKYREKYGKKGPFRVVDSFGSVEGPEGFTHVLSMGWEDAEGPTDLDQLNEAFRLGYRAALMEKA